MKAKYLFTTILFGLCFIFYAAAQDSISDFEILKESYIRHDDNLLKTIIEADKTKISAQKTLIANGFNISASTGTVYASFLSDKFHISVSPEIDLEFPQLNDTTLSLTAPFTLNDGSVSKIDDAGITVSTGILSKTARQRKCTLMQMERNILEAVRGVSNATIQAEKQFLTDLRELFEILKKVGSAQNTLLEDQLDLDYLVTQGYGKTSAKYRTAYMTVQKDKLNVEEQRHNFRYKLVVFQKKCDDIIELTEDRIRSLNIPEIELDKIRKYKREDYTALEKAEWNSRINSLAREADIPVSLSAYGSYGYTYNDSGFGTPSENNSIQAGLSGSINGFTARAGTVFTIEDIKNPSLTFSLGYDLSAFKTKKLEKQSKELEEKTDELAIREAQHKFADDVASYIEKYVNLKWQHEENKTQTELYDELYKDSESWYSKGVISETEYRKSKVNYENSVVDGLLTNLDCMLYNINLSLLFVNDGSKNDKED